MLLLAAAAITLVIFATPLFSYARLFYGHALAACLPVAHIGIHLHEDGTGHLDQVRGFANRGVEPALIEFGKRLARMRHVPDCAIPPAQPAPLA